MAGREKVKLYHYAANGVYIGTFECMADVHRTFYEGRHYPLFQTKDGEMGFHELPDGSFVCKTRMGREGLRKAIRIASAPFCRENVNSRVVEVYNLLGKKVANFRSTSVAAEMLGLDQATLHSRCSSTKKCNNKDNLIFKFSEPK